jgi:cellulose synthase/poly-beta-1,6-N-acetylglucosamine synthase-like glycosyltransferase
MPNVSLIATVYNDVNGTRLFLKRMHEQTRRPDEIIICDAGSTDGTWELLAEYRESGSIPMTALKELGCRPARGRNLAAAVASHEVLAVTDIGCDWDPQWLEELVAPFEANPGLEAVMGSWRVRWEDQLTPWAKADFALQNGLEFRAVPRSHSANRAIAYRKDFYCRLGGLPEDLTFAADDMTLALLIQKLGVSLAAAPEPRCCWFRPQSLPSLLKEARRNFRGSGEAGIWLKHFTLVSGRLVLEFFAIIALLIAISAHSAVRVILLIAIVCAALVLWRVWRWSRTATRFSNAGLDVSVVHLALLDYLVRWYGLSGYLEGVVHGFTHCRRCRARLRAAKISWAYPTTREH